MESFPPVHTNPLIFLRTNISRSFQIPSIPLESIFGEAILYNSATQNLRYLAFGPRSNVYALILETSDIEALTLISRILKCNKFYLEHFSSAKTLLTARDQMLNKRKKGRKRYKHQLVR